MDEENLQEDSLSKTSKIMGIFSLIFVVVYIVASVVGKKLPDLFYKLVPAVIGGTGFTGVVCAFKCMKKDSENTSNNLAGLIISSIGLFAAICLI